MKRALVYLALGLLVYLAALAITFPASRAYGLAHHYFGETPLPVAAAGIDGSLWRGSADLLAVQGVKLGPAAWHISPLHLLGGALAGDWRVAPAGGNVEGRVRYGLDGTTELREVTGQLPVAWLLAQFAHLPVQVDGTLSLQLEGLTLGPELSGSGTVVWNGAAITAPQSLKLGDLKLVITPAEGGGLSGALSDAGGPLSVAGTLSVSADRLYRIDARLAAREPGSPLVQALRLLGPPGPDGKVKLQMSGRL